jgi:hypothetical protein
VQPKGWATHQGWRWQQRSYPRREADSRRLANHGEKLARFHPPSWPGDNTDLFCVTQEVPKMVTDDPEPAAEQATPQRRRERDSWAASFFPLSLSWYWCSRTRMHKWLGERAGRTPQAPANPTRPFTEDGTPARTVSTSGDLRSIDLRRGC